jgi:glycosyltransferase involved in cell wall biosynthesis
MSERLIDLGYDVTILTGYGRRRYYPVQHKVKIAHFSAIKTKGIFRISLLFNICLWLLRNTKKKDIVILPPGGLVIAPFLRLFRRNRLHLDVRTVPVEVHSLKDRVDRLFYWKITMRFLHRLARGYSFITMRLKSEVEYEFNIRFNDYTIWESGVNVNRFFVKPALVDEDNEKTFVLFYHGTISPNRGIDRVIEGISLIDERYRKHMNFIIVGAGPALLNLQTLALKLGLKGLITFRGLVPYERIPEEIAKADCCICPLPALKEWDISSPIKVFEYMASGKPMILTPINAHRDVANGQDYVVWTKGDNVEDFQNAIEFAYVNRLKLSKASQRASNFVKLQYDWSIQGQKLANYFAIKFR